MQNLGKKIREELRENRTAAAERDEERRRLLVRQISATRGVSSVNVTLESGRRGGYRVSYKVASNASDAASAAVVALVRNFSRKFGVQVFVS